MANVLTNLIPTIYEALDTVSREMVGFIPAVYKDANAERAAVGQTIRIPVVPTATAMDITAAATGPAPNDSTVGSTTMTISKSRMVPWYDTAEEAKGLDSQYMNITRDRIAQAMRTLVNEVEADLGGLYYGASRAYGTTGANPFDRTDLDGATQVLKILEDNGCPKSNLRLIINTSLAQKLRTQKQIVSVAEAGTASGLRQGIVGDIAGFQVGVSGQVKTHTAGTLTAAARTNGSQAIGNTALVLTSGVGTVLAGDLLSFNSTLGGVYPHKYIVGATASDNTNITLNSPGVFGTAIPTDSTVNRSAAYSANMAFDSNALVLIARTPAMPQGGDSADDVTIVQDPVSGLAFQICVYRQFKRVTYTVELAWGVKAVKSNHLALLVS